MIRNVLHKHSCLEVLKLRRETGVWELLLLNYKHYIRLLSHNWIHIMMIPANDTFILLIRFEKKNTIFFFRWPLKEDSLTWHNMCSLSSTAVGLLKREKCLFKSKSGDPHWVISVIRCRCRCLCAICVRKYIKDQSPNYDRNVYTLLINTLLRLRRLSQSILNIIWTVKINLSFVLLTHLISEKNVGVAKAMFC